MEKIVKILTIITLSIASTINNEANSQTVGIGILKDVSKSTLNLSDAFYPNKITDALLKELALENSGKGVNLFTATLGTSSIPKFQKIELDEINWWITPRNMRKAAITEFESNVRFALDSLSKIPNEEFTNLYRGILFMVRQMNLDMDNRKLIIYSDLIETSSIINFSKYWNKPEQLLPDYEKIKSALLADEELPIELKDLEIILICPGESELVVQASRFWKKLFEQEADSKVSIRSSY